MRISEGSGGSRPTVPASAQDTGAAVSALLGLVASEVRSQLLPQLADELRAQLLPQLASELRAQLLPQLADELSAQLLPPFIAEIRGLRAVVTQSPERWVTRAQAAQVLGLCLDSVDNRIKDRTLRSQKLGRSVRVLIPVPVTDDEIAELARKARGAK